MNNSFRVGCYCGWRGRRVIGDCACYDEWAMYCRCAFGSCPKCGGAVHTMTTIKASAKASREFDRDVATARA